MQSFDDAEALARQEKDLYYVVAFMIQCWLAELLQRDAAEYAEKKNPKDRSLQSGEAWQSFQQMFAVLIKKGYFYLLSCLFRFSASDPSPRNSLRHALIPLSIEHHQTNDYFGPKTMDRVRSGAITPQPSGHSQLSTLNSQLAEKTILRWCDWLDAAIHLRTHRRWHFAPECFDPDPEKRELAALGNAQRHLTALDLPAQVSWLWDFANAAHKYKDSPKWSTLGIAMSAQSDRPWLYPDVDTLVISLWPLVKTYNWTYRDLLNVMRSLDSRPSGLSPFHRYPCDYEQDFSAYCANVLGLRKIGKGRTAKNRQPAGFEIARQLWTPIQQEKTETREKSTKSLSNRSGAS